MATKQLLRAAISTPTDPPTLRAAIYDRVSRDFRGDARSVKRQGRQNRKAVEDNSWTLIGEYYDNDRSASRFATKSREDWPRLVEALSAQPKPIDVLVLWEVSRGSRDVIVWFPVLEACRQNGVLVHITKDERTYDPRNSRDWKTLANEIIDSADESNKTSDRITGEALDAAQQGKPWGHCPYGYMRQYDPRKGTLLAQVPDPETAKYPIEIIFRIARGDAINEIRLDFQGRGLLSPRGKEWSNFTIRAIATNPVYIGMRSHKGVLYKAQWPIITNNPDLDEEFERAFYAAQRILSDPKRKVTRPGRYKWLQSYLSECGKCGGPLSVRWSKDVKDWVYHCHNRPGGCVSTRVTWFDEPVEEMTIARLDREDAYELFALEDDAIAATAELEAERLQAEYDQWMDEATDVGLSPREIKQYEQKHLPAIKAARKRAQDARVPLALRELLDPTVNTRKRWESMSIPAKREVLSAVYEHIALDPIKVKGTGQGGLDWTRVRVLPRGETEWVTLTSREDIIGT